MDLINLHSEYVKEKNRLSKTNRISANLNINNVSGHHYSGGYENKILTYLATEALHNLQEKFLKEIRIEIFNVIDHHLNKIKE